jgi:hypothetical protein
VVEVEASLVITAVAVAVLLDAAVILLCRRLSAVVDSVQVEE